MKHLGSVQPVPQGLVDVGPLVEVTLAPHSRVVAATATTGQPPTSPISAKLMIDTGAQKTVVEKKLAEQLGLVPIRFQPMVGVSQKPELCPVYLMSVSIGMSDGTNTGFAAFETEVIGMASPPRPQGHQGLLGRDFLRHMRFVYNGPTGTFEVSAAAFAQQAKGISPLAAAAAGGTRGPTPEQLRKAKRKAEKAARRKNRHR